MTPLDRVWQTVSDALGLPLPPLEPHGPHDVAADIPAEALLPLLEALRERGLLHHLSAITATRRDGALWLLYHLWLGTGLTLRVAVPEQARVPSLRALLPVAEWYEREIHDLYGLTFTGHERPEPLLFSAEEGRPPPFATEEDVP